MRKLLWATLLPREADRGGGSTYSTGVRRLLERELGGRFDELHVLPLDLNRRRQRLLAGLAGSMVSRQSAKLLYCRSSAAIARVRASDADMLVCDHVETAYLMRHFRGRTCLVLHNVEGELMQQRGESGSPLNRWFLSREGRRMLRFERWAIEHADNVISLSPADINTFARLVPGKSIRHVPPLFDYPASDPSIFRNPPLLGFVGNLDWWPNAEALRWYLAHVHPHHELHLHVMGTGNAAFLAGVDRVTTHGFVPNIRDVWSAFDVMIAPILSGSGVSIKTAEALYNGKPVIATATGARGLPSPQMIAGLRICGSAEDWIATLRALAEGAAPLAPDDATRLLFSAQASPPRS